MDSKVLQSEGAQVLHQINKSVNSHINRIYDGKIIPDLGIHYINLISYQINPVLSILHYCWNIIEQNTFNSQFKILIITNNPNNYDDMIKWIIDEKFGNMFINDMISINRIKKHNKPSIMIINESESKEMIDKYKPDIIMIEEIDTMSKKLYKILNGILDKIAIISYLDNRKSNKCLKYLDNETICYKAQHISDIISNKKINIHLIKIDNIIDKLNDIMVDKTIKKILCITKTNSQAKKLYKLYKKDYMDRSALFDIQPYDNLESFSRLYTPTIFHKKLLEHTIDTCADNGIMFICSDSLDIYNIQKICNVNCIILLDDMLKDNKIMYETLILNIASNTVTTDLSFVEILDKNLHEQLYRIGKIIYNKKNIDIYKQICIDIDKSNIILDVKFNETRKNKLQRIFKLTENDMRIINCANTLYTIPISKSSEIYEQYMDEQEYMDKKISTNKLNKQLINIDTTKEYSGPKWLSSIDKCIIPQNLIAFVEKNVKICRVLAVSKFSRKHKRSNWKEKINRDKNILFLSSIIDIMSLSEFRKLIGIHKDDKILYMDEYILDLI